MKLNISAVQLNVTSCQAELASERADRLLTPPQGAGQGMPPRHLPSTLGPGQLPDINPDAVSVVRKETNGSPGLAIGEAGDHEEAIIPRGSSSRRPVSVASYVSSSSQSNKESAEAPGVVPAPKVVVNEAGVMPALPGNLDKAEDDANIVQEEEPGEDDQNPDGLIDERVVLDKQNYLVDKNGVDDEEEETEDVQSDVKEEEAEEGFDAISNEGNEAEEKLENLKENLDKDDTLSEAEQW